MRGWVLVFIVASALSGNMANGAVVFQTFSSFGGDGWLSPSEAPGALSASGNLQRGMAYNPMANQLYVVDRNGGTNVRILNADTGAFIGNLAAPIGGFTGGLFTGNLVSVGGDGAIYMGNLSSTPNGTATQQFKVYRWANSAATPTVAFQAPIVFPRVGDTFSVIGSGVDTRIVASGSGSSGVTLLTTTNGTDFTATVVNPAPAASGSFRLGLDFLDPNTIIGKQTSSNFIVGNLSTLATSTITPTSAGETALAVLGSESMLASVDANSSLVRFYDLTASPGLQLTQSLTTIIGASVANGNGTGALDFGVDSDGRIRLYALNTHNGIQAFRSVAPVAIPEPTSLVALSLVGAGFVARRRRRTQATALAV